MGFIAKVTARDNRLGWWGLFHHYEFHIDSFDKIVDEIFDRLQSYETPVVVCVDGRTVYRREV